MADRSSKVFFFTNHAYVLASLLKLNGAPLRIIAQDLGLTERAVQGIVSDLEKLGAITREKIGRTNSYAINRNIRLPGLLEKHRTVDDILQLFEKTEVEVDTKPHTPKQRLLVTLK